LAPAPALPPPEPTTSTTAYFIPADFVHVPVEVKTVTSGIVANFVANFAGVTNNFAEFPELRTSIENGITLSEKAHKEFHKKYGFRNNTKEQLQEFLTNK
jgi:hypothetical protein